MVRGSERRPVWLEHNEQRELWHPDDIREVGRCLESVSKSLKGFIQGKDILPHTVKDPFSLALENGL